MMKTRPFGAGLSRRDAAILFGSGVVAAATGRAASAASSDPLRIGFLADFSGPSADNGGRGTALAVQMAIEDFGGEVFGRKIELLAADDQANPDLGASIARQWFDREKIQALVSGSTTTIAFANQQLAEAYKKPFLLAGTGSSDFTGKSCSPMTVQFLWDTYATSKAVVGPLVRSGKDTWYFIGVNLAFGKQLTADTSEFVRRAGGKIVEEVFHPQGTADYSSYLLRAQSSGAKVVAFANYGSDMQNAIKQAHEFGLQSSAQSLVALGPWLNNIKAIGLEHGQGLVMSTPFYHNMTEESRAWARRFRARYNDIAPNAVHASGYSATLHYLKALRDAGTEDGPTVMQRMRRLPISDFQNKDVQIREDGQAMRPYYVAEVKKPAESRDAYDLVKIVAEVPPEEAWRPLSESGCQLVKAR